MGNIKRASMASFWIMASSFLSLLRSTRKRKRYVHDAAVSLEAHGQAAMPKHREHRPVLSKYLRLEPLHPSVKSDVP
jgi:hypothetical protein